MNFSEMMKNQYIIIGLIVVAASMFALTVRGGDTEQEVASTETVENAKEVQAVSIDDSKETLEVIVEADVPAEKETTEEITLWRGLWSGSTFIARIRYWMW